MAKLVERLKMKRFGLGVKQHALVLEFTTAVEDAMNATEVTQSDLARRLGKSRSWISKVFRRKPNLTFFTAVEIADALGLEVELSVVEAPREAVGPTWVYSVSLVPGEVENWTQASPRLRETVETVLDSTG